MPRCAPEFGRQRCSSERRPFRVKVSTFKLSAAWRIVIPPDSSVWAISMTRTRSRRRSSSVGRSIRAACSAAPASSISPARTRQATPQYRPSRMWRPLPPSARSSRYQLAGARQAFRLRRDLLDYEAAFAVYNI
ncbi:hypothetical protein [Streptosporangium sp. CA-115845]|uniref:hypothetical protein n=1 Tax=Streptosporangium sp. CA-115845 TaxID=3240071 RepID=UPI003D8B58D1